MTEEVKKNDIRHGNSRNLSELKLLFFKKLLKELKENKFSILKNKLDENKADPYNERQTVDVDIDVEYDPSKKQKNKKSSYGAW